jgi:hypothetical protein
MSGTVLNHFERLQTLLVEARQAIEQAEARVGQFNELVRGLAEQGEVPRGFFLGKTIASPWDAEAGRCNAGHVIQAVLLVPEGVGVSRFDAEVSDAYTESSGGLEDEVRLTFVPFAACSPAEKTFFYSEMEVLCKRFLACAAGGKARA